MMTTDEMRQLKKLIRLLKTLGVQSFSHDGLQIVLPTPSPMHGTMSKPQEQEEHEDYQADDQRPSGDGRMTWLPPTDEFTFDPNNPDHVEIMLGNFPNESEGQ